MDKAVDKIMDSDVFLREKKMEKRDKLFFMCVFFLNAIILFVGLGSFRMPQTSMEIVSDSEKSGEIVLDIGEYKKVQTLYLHLGHILDRVVAVSYFDEKSNEWVVIDEKVDIESNYNWSAIEINKEIRYLGIVSRNEKIVLNEIVLLDDAGNIINPINHMEYPLLFDEEELFPDDLTYYYRTMFDEVFYAGSAYEFLQGEVMAEVTHPPMGKILISIGLAIFGVTPFGWRFISALFGLGMIPLIYWFLYRLFRNSRVALIGMMLLSMDFMHFALSRIGTLDTIVAFFILATFAMMWEVFERIREELHAKKSKPTWSLVSFMIFHAFVIGMSVSCKWTGFYAMAGAAVCFAVFWMRNLTKSAKNKDIQKYLLKLLGEAVLIYSMIPLCIYVLSFVPQTLAQGDHNVWKVMWDSSIKMLDFHDSIVFEHPYSSSWYTWLWDKMPLIDAANVLQDGKVSLVVTIGHPILWWCGILSLLHMLYRFLVKKDYKAGYLVAAYLFMLIPWMFVKRTVFIYQYYGSSLFLICMLSYSLSLLGEKRKNLVPIFIEIVLCIFLTFFPILSGLPVSSSYIQNFLQWLPDWKFII